MKILAMDTSTKNFSIAVSDNKSVLTYKNIVLNKILSSSIMPTIQMVLKRRKMTLKDIDVFAIGLGPGSFTGLRVGLSTVKAMAFALGKRVVGIPSLDILAMNIKEDNAQICTLMDAKRDMVYACLYQKKNSSLKRKCPHCLTTINKFLSEVRGDTLFIGDGLKIWEEEIISLRKKEKAQTDFVSEKLWMPQAQQMIPLVITRCQAGQYDKSDKLLPLYLYKDDCQVRR